METFLFAPENGRIMTAHGAGYADTSSLRHHVKNSDFIFEYVLSGEECVESPDIYAQADTGTLIVIHPAKECVLYKNAGGTSALFFRISGAVFEATADVLSLPRIFTAHADAFDKFITATELFGKYSSGDGAAGRALCEIALSLLLDAAQLSASAASGDPLRPSAEAIKEYLDLCLCGDVDLSSVGERFGITGMHVIRLFRAKYDMTPMQYLKIKRLDKAASLLAGSHMSIKEISSLLRFSNTQHFTNLFRDRFGKTPGKFREDAARR